MTRKWNIFWWVYNRMLLACPFWSTLLNGIVRGIVILCPNTGKAIRSVPCCSIFNMLQGGTARKMKATGNQSKAKSQIVNKASNCQSKERSLIYWYRKMGNNRENENAHWNTENFAISKYCTCTEGHPFRLNYRLASINMKLCRNI